MGSTPSVRLKWTGDLVFEGGAEGGPRVTLDSDGARGPSPTQLLLLSLAGCMGVDVALILEKGRVPLDALEIAIEGDRVDTEPRRFEKVRMRIAVAGPAAADQPKVERAVRLSREKYCSVLHTLRPDLDFDVLIDRR